MLNRIKKFHFVGIGGSGMSGIAEVLLNLGYQVSGSDLKEGEATQRLASLGASIQTGHQASNVAGAEVVVVSNAVLATNPEIVEAQRLKIPVIPRAEMLNELMRLKYGVCISGTHGKTTTTSMTGLILTEAGLDPTIVIGGVLAALGSNARLGKGDYFVVEADEAFGSFLHLNPAVAVVTNVDNDHLDFYGNMDNLKAAFVQFLNKVPFYGYALVCGEDPVALSILPQVKRRVLTYGFSEQQDWRAGNLRRQGQETLFEVSRQGKLLGSMALKVPGRHNVLNALAALGASIELGVPFDRAAKALAGFTGAQRRFQVKGRAGGVLVVDDYAHHPTEVTATLSAARSLLEPGGRLLVAFQPHLFSRTQALYREFASALSAADQVFLSDIFPARETPIPGVSSQLIVDSLKAPSTGSGQAHHTSGVLFRPTLDELLPAVLESLKPGDLFLTAGAGNVWQLGMKVLEKLQAREGAVK
jgi:UDP-N-acetylmuramate--alanine ligase